MAPTFLQEVAALRESLGIDESLSIPAAVAMMNSFMGLEAASLSLPEQVKALVRATGLELESCDMGSGAAPGFVDFSAAQLDCGSYSGSSPASSASAEVAGGSARIGVLNQCEHVPPHTRL